jgi:methionine-rich copper-binding protein CopC
MIRRVLATALAVTIALLVTATAALAHAHLERSSPAQGARLTTPPTTVALTFGEAVTVGATPITVTGPGGAAWKVGKVSITDSTVSAAVTATGPAGLYTLAYTVTSDDGDDVSGKITFTMAAAAAPTTSAAPTTTAAPAPTSTATSAATTAATPAGAATTPTDSGGIPVWIWVVVAVLVLGGIGAVLARRTRN